MLVFVEGLLPLFSLHVAEAQSPTCCRIIWELRQRPLVLLRCRCPLTIPAVAIGCIHCCAEDLSVPRHGNIHFLDSTDISCRHCCEEEFLCTLFVHTTCVSHIPDKTRLLHLYSSGSFLVLKYLI